MKKRRLGASKHPAPYLFLTGSEAAATALKGWVKGESPNRSGVSLVEMEGFEPPVPCSQSRCLARLGYISKSFEHSACFTLGRSSDSPQLRS